MDNKTKIIIILSVIIAVGFIAVVGISVDKAGFNRGYAQRGVDLAIYQATTNKLLWTNGTDLFETDTLNLCQYLYGGQDER